MATASVTNTLVALTLAESSDVNQNFGDLVSFLNTQTMHRDASSAFTAVPSGPATDPSSDNQLARKAYVDGQFGVVTYSGPTNTSLAVEIFNSFSTSIARGITATATGFTVVTAGWYDVGFAVGFSTSSGGTRRNVQVFLNGVGASLTANNDGFAVTGGFGTGVNAAKPMLLSVADVLSLRYTQDSGILLTANVTFWARRIR